MTGTPLPSPPLPLRPADSGLPTDLVAALAELAGRRPLLVAGDYDGVLASLVGDPSAAVLQPGVADALARLAETDGPLPEQLAARRDALAERLAPLVAAVPGARLEVKPASMAVHVRQVADRAAATALRPCRGGSVTDEEAG